MKKRVLVVFALCVAMLSFGCGSNPTSGDPKQQEQPPQEEESAAVETILGAGEWYVGEDIPAGRYVITPPEDDSGNIAVYDEGKDYASKSDILNPFGTNGVKSLTWNLKDGQIVKIEGMEDVLFTPKED